MSNQQQHKLFLYAWVLRWKPILCFISFGKLLGAKPSLGTIIFAKLSGALATDTLPGISV